MRRMLLSATIIAVFPVAAWAQARSDDMTCEEAVAYYEKHGRIDTTDEGQVLPIYGDVPVSERQGMFCDEDDMPTPTLVKTRDKEECAIAYSCPGE